MIVNSESESGLKEKVEERNGGSELERRRPRDTMEMEPHHLTHSSPTLPSQNQPEPACVPQTTRQTTTALKTS